MAYFIIFGTKATKLIEKRLNANTSCPYCQQKSSFILKGEANYFHLFWIPVIPLGKELYVQCVHCHNKYFKKDFAEDVKKAVQLENIRRPIWHYIVPAFLLFKIVSALFVFGYFYVEDAIQESKHEKLKAEENLKAEERKQTFINDKKSMQLSPSLTTDSISYKIKEEFPFSEYDVDAEQVALFSKIEDKKLLLLIDVKENGKLIEAEGCVLVNDVKNFLIQTYQENYFKFYIALFENNELKMLHTPENLYVTKFQSKVPLYGFYEDEVTTYYGRSSILKDRYQKLKLFATYGKKDIKSEKIDSSEIEKGLKKITDKFKFSYRNRQAPVDKRVLYECKFTLETGNVLPDELRTMFKLYDGNGPFFNWNFLYSKTTKINQAYKNATIESLKANSEFDEQLLPVYKSPYWIPFYEDNTYSYALDMLPSEKGQVGQVILLEAGKKPIYIAKNMTEFLKLFHNEKVPTDFEDWL